MRQYECDLKGNESQEMKNLERDCGKCIEADKACFAHGQRFRCVPPELATASEDDANEMCSYELCPASTHCAFSEENASIVSCQPL